MNLPGADCWMSQAIIALDIGDLAKAMEILVRNSSLDVAVTAMASGRNHPTILLITPVNPAFSREAEIRPTSLSL